jgi:hypothetical protein
LLNATRGNVCSCRGFAYGNLVGLRIEAVKELADNFDRLEACA